MNWKMALLVLVATVIAIVVMARGGTKGGGSPMQSKGYYEMSKDEQLAVHKAYGNEIWRLKQQVEWRLEQAKLYHRWGAQQIYQDKLNTLNWMLEVLRDMRADPTVYHYDLQKIDNWLKTGN